MAAILVSNPGSASRKYAVFDGDDERLRLQFEYINGQITQIVLQDGNNKMSPLPDVQHLTGIAARLSDVLHEHALPVPDAIALRIVAPSAYFLQHRRLDAEAIERLRSLQPRSPLHIDATLQELESLQQQWPDVPVFGVSDSAFHATKPDYAWNYGIKLEDADQHEIKRFGYHGLSAASVVRQLGEHIPRKLVVCHLGSGVSVMAIRSGKSQDTTMGYSPLEGLIMSTRSGTVDITAVRALQEALHLSEKDMRDYLNNRSGLLGLSGSSSDIRELLAAESDGSYRAGLALNAYVYRIQQAIGQMMAGLGGVDALVFTGAVGERSPVIRQRIVSKLHFLEFELDHDKNLLAVNHSQNLTYIHTSKTRPVIIIPAKEEQEMALAAASLL